MASDDKSEIPLSIRNSGMSDWNVIGVEEEILAGTTMVKRALYSPTTKVKMKAYESEETSMYQTIQASTMTVKMSEKRSRYSVITLSMVSRSSGVLIIRCGQDSG